MILAHKWSTRVSWMQTSWNENDNIIGTNSVYNEGNFFLWGGGVSVSVWYNENWLHERFVYNIEKILFLYGNENFIKLQILYTGKYSPRFAPFAFVVSGRIKDWAITLFSTITTGRNRLQVKKIKIKTQYIYIF